MSWCTYLWLREDGSPYYVGKGSSHQRALISAGHTVRRPKDSSRIRIYEMPEEAIALAYERYLIDFWGRKDIGTGILRNRTDGGEGLSGWVPSPETRTKIGEANRGRKNPSVAEANRRRAVSAETRRKQGEATRRRFQDEEYRRDWGQARRGKSKPLSPEGKLAVIESNRSRSAASRQNASLAVKRHNHIRWHINRGIKKPECPECQTRQ